MPRRYALRKKTYRKYKKRTTGVKRLAKQVSVLRKQALDKRIKDYALTGNAPTTWSWISIVSLPLGDGDGFRADSNITAKSLTLMGNIKYKVNDADNNLSAGIRIVVMVDTQYYTGFAANPEYPWQDNRFDSLIAAPTRGRFSILSDRIFQNSDDRDMTVIRYSVPINKTCRYQGDVLQRNIIYLAVCGISTEVLAQVMDIKARLHYVC